MFFFFNRRLIVDSHRLIEIKQINRPAALIFTNYFVILFHQ